MALLIHICIAIISLVGTGALYLAPSKIKLQASYGLVALTLISGVYLVATTRAHLASACASGLVYLAIVSVGIAAGRAKLARQSVHLR